MRSNHQLKEAYNVRIEELQVLDLKFLHSTSGPLLCILFRKPSIEEEASQFKFIRTYATLMAVICE